MNKMFLEFIFTYAPIRSFMKIDQIANYKLFKNYISRDHPKMVPFDTLWFKKQFLFSKISLIFIFKN